MNIELIGIAATMLVLISFLMRDAAKIRKVNIIGAALFVVYGLLVGSLSVWLLNGILVFIHVRFLLRER